MIKIENKLLESLTSLLLWYKEAGIVSLNGNEAVNQIAILKKLREKQATSLSPTTQTVVEKPPASTIVQKTVTSHVKLENKKEVLRPKAYNVITRDYESQLLSQSAQAALNFVKECSSFSEIKEKIVAQNFLSLQKTAAHTFVGEGNEEAQLMIISDAPSSNDDREGQMLSGSAGLLFDKILASIGLARTDVFILPVVFWRPPGDRKPTATEIATCLPIVEKIISQIDPRFMISLGALAGQILTGQNTSLSKMRGKFYTYKNITEAVALPNRELRPLYHPLDLIATPALKADAWCDLLAIQQKMKES